MPMDKSRLGGIAEPEVFHLVQHLDRDFQTKAQVAVGDQLSDTLLLEQAVDERHALGKVIVQDGASDGRVQEAALRVHWLGVDDFLIVVGGQQVDHFTGVAQTESG